MATSRLRPYPHLHTQALSDRLLPTADADLQATFPCIFQSFFYFPPLMNNTFSYTKLLVFSLFDRFEHS